MDFVPFTLFFMVCLMGYQGSLAMPHECLAPAGKWPEDCKDTTYCFCKPEDYPNAEKIQELIKKSDIDFSSIKQPTLDNRIAENVCRFYDMKDPIYMIKDTDGEVRYVVQDPNVFQYQIQIEECHKEQVLGELADQVECRQKFTPMKFVVLTRDQTGVELAGLDKGLPTSCAPVLLK